MVTRGFTGKPPALDRPDSASLGSELVVHSQNRSTPGEALDMGGVQCSAAYQDDPRHPLRHQVVETEYSVERRPDR